MLDIKFIIQNKEIVLKSIKERGVKADLEDLIFQYSEFRRIKTEIESLRAESNDVASKNNASLSLEQKQEVTNKGTSLKIRIKELEEKNVAIEATYKKSLLTIPNVLPNDTPVGVDDFSNLVIREFLKPTKFSFVPKDHVRIGEDLDLLDFEGGAKVAGSKFYFLKNEAVLLEMALKQFVITKALKKGYTLLQTPELARHSILTGSGYSPRGNESNTYRIEGEDLSLIATSEIAVGGYHSSEVFLEKKLPLKYAADSHCFRTEAGGAGRASKGLYRVHQFSKIELYIFCIPEDSDKFLEEILELEESIYQDLKIPYRVMRICAGDLGAPAYKKYDIEAWMPGKEENGGYGEITSASNCTDFQSRRLNIKYKSSRSKKNEFVHTLNGTAIALSRTLISILENYQTENGEVAIPEVLKPYMGIEIIKKK